MKEFFKTAFASTLGVLIATGIIFCCLIFSLMGIAVSSSGGAAYSPKKNTVFKLELNGEITENVISNPFDEFMGQAKGLSLADILKAIRLAKENKNIVGIYIESKGLSAAPATVETIHRALEDFKESGKFVIAYGDSYDNSGYYLASVADSVFVNPQGMVELTGLASQGIFYTGLAEKAGVEVYTFKVGTYKGAVEPFMLKQFSDENREQIMSYMNSIWDNMISEIVKSRNITPESLNHFINEGLFVGDAKATVDYKLTDGLRYKHEVENSLKAMTEQSADEKLRTAGIDKINRIKDKKKEKSDKIAILYAEGEIVESASSSPFGGGTSTITERTGDELKKLKDDEDVKAVVFRVNSPGGSAYISEQIWGQLVELKAVKPVVVSMGDYAASGGYYISCAADMIVAERNTLTGSIGVFGQFPNAAGLLEKIGITTDIVKTNNYSDLGDFTRPMRDDEKALFQKYVEQTYDLFLSRCADGRGMTKEQIDAIGQGRVWTGEQALELGLVDKLGDIDTAIEEAAALAELDDYSVITHTNNRDFFSEFFEKQMEDIKMSFVKNFLGDEYELYNTLQRVKRQSGIQARLPYDLINKY